jgi:transcriptional regulator with XRE-family HTH domain
MSTELGAWLRQQRQARGWAIPDMARRLREAAKDSGDKAVPGNEAMCRNIRRWERGAGGVSERHKLHYCNALGIAPARFGPRPAPSPMGDPANTATPGPPAILSGPFMPYVTPGPHDLGLGSHLGVAYRWMQAPDLGDSTVEREVLMAAHEGSEHAERAEQRGIGEATLEQLRADVIRLSHEYMTSDPLPLFLEMRRVRSRIYGALDRQLWPRDQTQLYFLLGCLNCLMAGTADDLGNSQAAEELNRAAWAYAVAIDHRPLMGKLRLDLASLAYWNDQPRRARDLAESGLGYIASGPTAVQLHLTQGRAAARLGDFDTGRREIGAAAEAGAREQHDELLEIGGEFDLSQASQRYLAGSVLIEIPDAVNEAVAELERAAELYVAGPQEGETHGYGMEALAHAGLATGQLRAGHLDAAVAAVAPVLDLPSSKRIHPLPERLSAVRAELAQPRYHGSAEASELDERIEAFARETIADDLGALPAGPS